MRNVLLIAAGAVIGALRSPGKRQAFFRRNNVVSLASSSDGISPRRSTRPCRGAICTSNQGEAEEAMLRYKDSLGYVSFGLPDGETAWVSK